jgi:hypothetical protein
MIKLAAIESVLEQEGVTSSSLLRFARRYFESRMRGSRDQIIKELRASRDPNATLRAWIVVNMLNPLIEKFTSPRPEDQLIKSKRVDEINAATGRTYEQQVQLKTERAREWVSTLITDYVDIPEFSYTMLSDLYEKFGPKTYNSAPAVRADIVGTMATSYLQFAERAWERTRAGGTDEELKEDVDGGQAHPLDQEILEQIREADEEIKNLHDVVAAENITDPNNAIFFDIKRAETKKRLLQGRMTVAGENLAQLYDNSVYYAEKQARDAAAQQQAIQEQEKALHERRVGRWKKVPQAPERSDGFLSEEAKYRYLHDVFRTGTICLADLGYNAKKYVSEGDIWVLLDDGGQVGLVAISLLGKNRIQQFQNAYNRPPVDYIDEIKSFLRVHPEIRTDDKALTGHSSESSMREWLEKVETGRRQFNTPEEISQIFFSDYENRALLSQVSERIVTWPETVWNRLIGTGLLRLIAQGGVATAATLMSALLTRGQRPYAGFRARFNELSNNSELPEVRNMYMAYIQSKCERIKSFEDKMGAALTPSVRAHFIAAQSRCNNNQISEEGKKEIVANEGALRAYLEIHDAPRFTGEALLPMMRHLVGNPRLALQIILKLHREGQNVEGVAPMLIPIIRNDPISCAIFATHIKRGRFREGEMTISKNPEATMMYVALLRNRYRARSIPSMRLPAEIRRAYDLTGQHLAQGVGGDA